MCRRLRPRAKSRFGEVGIYVVTPPSTPNDLSRPCVSVNGVNWTEQRSILVQGLIPCWLTVSGVLYCPGVRHRRRETRPETLSTVRSGVRSIIYVLGTLLGIGDLHRPDSRRLCSASCVGLLPGIRRRQTGFERRPETLSTVVLGIDTPPPL